MDDITNNCYRELAEKNNAVISPVGAVWRYIRENFPSIELYQTDATHPSVAGTYAAACCFYTVFFRKDPKYITFNSSLSNMDATIIRAAVKHIVYNNLLEWHVGEYDIAAQFTFSNLGGGAVTFNNQSKFSSDYLWDFGDGESSTEVNPKYSYVNPGIYTVSLITSRCGTFDVSTVPIEIFTVDLEGNDNKNSISIYNNNYSQSIEIGVTSTCIGKTYKIYNSLGLVVSEGVINSKHESVNVQKLKSGIYYFYIQDAYIQGIRINNSQVFK